VDLASEWEAVLMILCRAVNIASIIYVKNVVIRSPLRRLIVDVILVPLAFLLAVLYPRFQTFRAGFV